MHKVAGVDEGLHLGESGGNEDRKATEERLTNLQTVETEGKQVNDGSVGQAKKEQTGMVLKQKR